MQPRIWTLRFGHEATRFDCAPLEAAPAFLGLLYLLSTLYCTDRRQYYSNYYRKLSHLGLRLGVCPAPWEGSQSCGVEVERVLRWRYGGWDVFLVQNMAKTGPF